mmetsp:Transcript_3994/g.15947  ORF Transcript_3994/g.15947 Transcript_3994/m.15947 type:complete len:297 (+) Transcript_3994:983-1873(+)
MMRRGASRPTGRETDASTATGRRNTRSPRSRIATATTPTTTATTAIDIAGAGGSRRTGLGCRLLAASQHRVSVGASHLDRHGVSHRSSHLWYNYTDTTSSRRTRRSARRGTAVVFVVPLPHKGRDDGRVVVVIRCRVLGRREEGQPQRRLGVGAPRGLQPEQRVDEGDGLGREAFELRELGEDFGLGVGKGDLVEVGERRRRRPALRGRRAEDPEHEDELLEVRVAGEQRRVPRKARRDAAERPQVDRGAVPGRPSTRRRRNGTFRVSETPRRREDLRAPKRSSGARYQRVETWCV